MRICNILSRKCLPLDGFDAAVAFYEKLIGQDARRRFDYPEMQLKLAQVGNLLLIGGSKAALAPFVATEMTFLVEDIAAWQRHLPTIGATVVEPVKAVPSGHNMLVRHGDGMLVEYVEHRDKHPDDRMQRE
ncbi:VOC family protein [Sphingomonas sp. 2R-10]|uniref:VOC family protein n=1 Tax=Sphingomonas sp. 2R-10 TaxID=3045148 RepID=UPI000F772F2F|nr:VOC family protein [Sphingomonas sp. 2R-10]MDJ0278085.1 VOC family protein [Sphingomonas sp. 2R-10]